MSDKTVINNWNGGGTLQTWNDGGWQILYAKDSAGNCVTLSLTSQDAIRLAYAVSPIPNEQFERLRAANEAVYELSYPEARCDELRQVADVIDCGGGCGRCGSQSLDRGEFCDFVAAENLRKLASALDLKAALSKPAPVGRDFSKVKIDSNFYFSWTNPAPVAADASAEAITEADIRAHVGDGMVSMQNVIDAANAILATRASAEARLREFVQNLDCECDSYHGHTCGRCKVLSAHPHASDCDKQGER